MFRLVVRRRSAEKDDGTKREIACEVSSETKKSN